MLDHHMTHAWQLSEAAAARCRERQDQLERAWWEEKAELSAGPAEQGGGGRFSDSAQEPESGHTSWQVRGPGTRQVHQLAGARICLRSTKKSTCLHLL